MMFTSAAIPVCCKVSSAANLKVNSLRAYGGYAGWAPRQLQAEIAQGGWYMIPADADTIFSADVATMWPELIKRIARRSAQLLRRRPMVE